MVGSDARIRLSLVISCPPGASGTLKSTRMKTVLPLRSKSRIETFGIGTNKVLTAYQTDNAACESRLQVARFLKPKCHGRGPTSVQQRDRVPLNCALSPRGF